MNLDQDEILTDYDNEADHQYDENVAAFAELPGTEGASDYIGGPAHRDGQDQLYDDLPTGCIRLLRILPSHTSNVVRCKLQHFVLDSKLKYTALSYTWGRGPDVDAIFVNNREMRIRKNLWRFLRQVRMFTPDRFDWLWIDSICINQSNNRERMHQVELMAKIFQAATSAIAWLGPSYCGSEGALDYFRSRTARRQTRHPPNIHGGRVSSIGIVSLCYRSYWRRLWILQEIVFARCIWLMCGDRISPWQPFRDVLLEIRDSFAVRSFAHSKWSRIGDRFEYTSMFNSPAMTIVTLSEQRTHRQSLYELLFQTKFLRCADQLDKVYALLSIAADCGDIQPDYDAMVEDVLNVVLRDYHKIELPQSLEGVVGQCNSLEELFDLQKSSMFRARHDKLDYHKIGLPQRLEWVVGQFNALEELFDLQNSSMVRARNDELDFNIRTPILDRSLLSFGAARTPITWWWISAHSHFQLEHIFWHEFIPDPSSFYHEAARKGDTSALQVLLKRFDFDVYFNKQSNESHIIATHIGHTDVGRPISQKEIFDSPNFQHYLCLGSGLAGFNSADLSYTSFLVNSLAHEQFKISKSPFDTRLPKSAELFCHFEITHLLLRSGAHFAAGNAAETMYQCPGVNELIELVIKLGVILGLGFIDKRRAVSFIITTFNQFCSEARTDTLQEVPSSSILGLWHDLEGTVLTNSMFDAAYTREWKVVQPFLDRIANIDVSHYGDTMLHIATLQGDVSAVKMLLDKGADVHRAVEPSLAAAPGSRYYVFGKPVTALKIAEKRRFTEIEQILLANIRARSVEEEALRKRRRSCSSPTARPPVRSRIN